ncbi:hypothetical protein [Metabacillus fastidiosus]|uniref:hypothetical protein n=1 Tax=Metabacillus fastidiosus TaxID=1458 RepID=UPI003D29208F
MTIKKIKFYVKVGDGILEETMEIHEDDCGEEMLAEVARDWIWDNIDFGWDEVKEEKK